MKIGFTGSRHGMTDIQRVALRSLLDGMSGEFHHGDCLGADYQAATIAKSMGFRIVSHPPADQTLRAFYPSDEERPPKPYLERNRAIVDETEMLIGTPKEEDEVLRSGTWATLRYAKKLDRPWWRITPDGFPVWG